MQRCFASIEALEARRLFNGGASVAHGVLRVYGDPFYRNLINVNNSTDGTAVDVNITWTTLLGVKKHFSAEFPKSLGLTKINIFGSFRNDTINVGQSNGALGIRTRIDSGRGDDSITTGSEPDVIYAGMGNDTVKAGSGNDFIYGGLGDDNLSGQDGNDSVWGGAGNDTCTGGNGDDNLGGVFGTNTLTGGAGHDTFVVQSLAANPSNDYNSSEDTLSIQTLATALDANAPADLPQ